MHEAKRGQQQQPPEIAVPAPRAEPHAQVEATTTPDAAAVRTLQALPWLLMAAGSVLRVCWPLDMEWKFDEKWMFATALRIARGHAPWPWLGMPSGVGLKNPGLSVWPFVLLARVAPAPVAMAQAIQWLNVLALWGMAVWVARCWPKPERELGRWGVALFAVSPLPILFARKIWAQDLLPVLLVPWLWAHSRRERPWGAFAWGLFGGLLGQLHMSGFFAAAALALATLVYDRKRFAFVPFVLGSACAILPMLPWLHFLLTTAPHAGTSPGHLSVSYVTQALRNAWGLGLMYPLGHDYQTFLAGPVLHGTPSHLFGLVRYGLLALFVYAVATLVRERQQLQASPLLRVYALAIALCGLLLLAAGVRMYAHYLIVWSPLLHVAAAYPLRRHKPALAALCGLQLLLSAGFLVYIHEHGGAPGADYGVAYSAQTPDERKPPR